jgi:hypothetical protein
MPVSEDTRAVVDDVVFTLAAKGAYGTCLPAAAILHELLPGSALVQGYLLTGATGETSSSSAPGRCGWHTWVEVGGARIDVGSELVAAMLRRHAAAAGGRRPVAELLDAVRGCRLSTTEVGERNDMGDAEERAVLQENERLLAEYRRDPGSFWSRAPARLRAARRALQERVRGRGAVAARVARALYDDAREENAEVADPAAWRLHREEAERSWTEYSKSVAELPEDRRAAVAGTALHRYMRFMHSAA